MANSTAQEREEVRQGNSMELSTFDVYTTSYFLSVAQTLEEHEEVKNV